jgi:hypothetical protein
MADEWCPFRAEDATIEGRFTRLYADSDLSDFPFQTPVCRLRTKCCSVFGAWKMADGRWQSFVTAPDFRLRTTVYRLPTLRLSDFPTFRLRTFGLSDFPTPDYRLPTFGLSDFPSTDSGLSDFLTSRLRTTVYRLSD